jgi:hypothetical protein
VGRKNLKAVVFSVSWLLLLEKEPGGADASVARVVDCSLFRAAGVLVCGISIAGAYTARSVSARHAQSSYQSAKRTMGRSLGSPCLGGLHHVYHLAA